MSRGYTLPEVIAVLLLIAILVGAGGPAVQGLTDRAALSSAQEALVGLIAEARVLAVSRGGATVVIGRNPPSATVSAEGSVVRSLDGRLPAAIRLDLGRDRETLTLKYDALGLGRVASATVRLRLRDTSRMLVISSYGRVRRR